MSLTIEYLVQRKHIFKKRTLNWQKRKPTFKVGSIGLFSLRNQLFELVYLRRFKKLIRRRHIRAKMKFMRRKFWIFLKPNCLFSGKSVNSRMGAGVGSYIRVAIILKAYKSFIEFKHYSLHWTRKIKNATRFRLPLKYIILKKNDLFYNTKFWNTNYSSI